MTAVFPEAISPKSVETFEYENPVEATAKYGAPLEYDPDFHGPLHQRSCTDVICLALFGCFLLTWGVLALIGITYGDPATLIHPSDSEGRLCGTFYENRYNLTDKPYLHFFDLTKCISYSTAFEGCPTKQVCVPECPDHYAAFVQLSPELLAVSHPSLTFKEAVSKFIICESDKIRDELNDYQDLRTAVETEECAAYVYATAPVVGRCVPKLITQAGTWLAEEATRNISLIPRETESGGFWSIIPDAGRLNDSTNFVRLMLNTKAFGEQVLSDLQYAWWQILLFLCVSSVLAFIWILAMRWIAVLMIWISMALALLLFGGGAAFCWWKYYVVKSDSSSEAWRFTINVGAYFHMSESWLVLAIVLSVLLVVILLLLIFLRKRLQIAVAVIKESSRAVVHMISALFFPIVPFILQMAAFAVWATVALYWASWGVPNCRRLGIPLEPLKPYWNFTNGSQCDCLDVKSANEPYCVFVNYTVDSNFVFTAQAVNLFGLFWLLFFADALCQLTLAGAFASYYWAFEKPQDIPKLPILWALWRAVRYHLGSLALGSLVLAIVRFVRAVMTYLQEKLEDSKNPCAKYVMRCLCCCCWCLEKVIKYLTKEAYIIIAIYGSNFCSSAKEAFLLTMRNVVRFWTVGTLTDFCLFLAKIVITGGVGAVSAYYFSGQWAWSVPVVRNLNFVFVPIVIVVLGTYLICCAFFDVYETAVDTTFICFLEDNERHDGTPQKPYFMSKNLLKILNKKNEIYRQKPP